MTYNEIIEIFKKKVQGHFFINEFGYGDISDISTPNDGKAPYYPYIFLNPVSVTSSDQVSSFNFNLICMTQCRDDHYQVIKKQSVIKAFNWLAWNKDKQQKELDRQNDLQRNNRNI